MFLVMRKTVSTGQKNFLALVPTGKTNFSFLVSITWTPWRNPLLKRIFYSAYLKFVLFLSHRFNLVYQIDPDIPQDLKLDHTTQFMACTMHMHSKKNRILRSAKLISAQNTALNADDKESYKYNPDKLRDIVKDFLTSQVVKGYITAFKTAENTNKALFEHNWATTIPRNLCMAFLLMFGGGKWGDALMNMTLKQYDSRTDLVLDNDNVVQINVFQHKTKSGGAAKVTFPK